MNHNECTGNCRQGRGCDCVPDIEEPECDRERALWLEPVAVILGVLWVLAVVAALVMDARAAT